MDNELLQAIGQMIEQSEKRITQRIEQRIEQEREHTQQMFVQSEQLMTQRVEQSEQRIRVLIETDVTKQIKLLFEGYADLDEKICQLRDLNDRVEDIQNTVSVLKALSVRKDS